MNGFPSNERVICNFEFIYPSDGKLRWFYDTKPKFASFLLQKSFLILSSTIKRGEMFSMVIISAELWESILFVDRPWGISFVDARCAGRRNIDANWDQPCGFDGLIVTTGVLNAPKAPEVYWKQTSWSYLHPFLTLTHTLFAQVLFFPLVSTAGLWAPKPSDLLFHFAGHGHQLHPVAGLSGLVMKCARKNRERCLNRDSGKPQKIRRIIFQSPFFFEKRSPKWHGTSLGHPSPKRFNASLLQFRP